SRRSRSARADRADLLEPRGVDRAGKYRPLRPDGTPGHAVPARSFAECRPRDRREPFHTTGRPRGPAPRVAPAALLPRLRWSCLPVVRVEPPAGAGRRGPSRRRPSFGAGAARRAPLHVTRRREPELT